MIDPDDPKQSILDTLLWTEPELKEYLRRLIHGAMDSTYLATVVPPPPDGHTRGHFGRNIRHKIAKAAMTFEPYEEPKRDPRTVVLLAIIACQGPNQPELFAGIKQSLHEWAHVSMTFCNQRSNEQTMVITFEAPRFKPLESTL